MKIWCDMQKLMLFSKSVTPNHLKSSLKPKSPKIVLGSVIDDLIEQCTSIVDMDIKNNT